ncbi:intraflagellar transport protein 140 homolog isoform X2 [Xenia sp. Carnegie-2017]|uniref:intraflagellar transport protein 140 homolog isoform X2 n=1 Tax=Xenia sp. Carnegie-2017 TaxID=2897299 RepID=UPI001F03E86F|nr:intraflagellar transport protein 140 homolog isoform X2 [Xenia sp. Carnegie-2017]
MALFFDNRIQSTSTSNTEIAWHRTYSLLAVASKNSIDDGGTVNFYLDEGEPLEESNVIKSSCQVSSMSWHPVRKIIAIGWTSGELNMWNEHDHDLHEVYSIHKSNITVIKWSHNGQKLVTADQNGILGIWKADSKGRLSHAPIRQHDCGSAITACLFRPLSSQENALDMIGLARAAVNGDENALDLFSSAKERKQSTNQIANSFIFGTADGTVFLVDDHGHTTSSFAIDGSVKTLLYYDGKDAVITVSDTMMLTQHEVLSDGNINEIMKVKISAGSGERSTIWAGQGVLATASGENVLRMVDIGENQNYILGLPNSEYDPGECITCIAYSSSKGILAGGTNLGKIAMWHSVANKTGAEVEGEMKWELSSPTLVQQSVLQLKWGGKGLLGVNTGLSVIILKEQTMNSHFNDLTAAIQISPSQLRIEKFETSVCHDLKTDIHIKGIYILKEHVVVWDGKRVVVYDLSADMSMVRAAGSFTCDSLVVVAHAQSVYTLEPGKIQVRNFQGTVKQVLSFNESEGDPIVMDVCSSFLVSATILGFVKVWDFSRREAKIHGQTKCFDSTATGITKILSAKVNCTGNKVCITCEKGEEINDSRLFVWDMELDVVQIFDFNTGCNDLDGENPTIEVAGRYPMQTHWDRFESKLLVCRAVLAPGNADRAKEDTNRSNGPPESLIVTLFSTPDHGIILVDQFPEEEHYTGFLGVHVPFIYFTTKKSEVPDEKKSADGTTAPFSLQRVSTRRTMRGNMDEAFKAIKLIKNQSVWENMARMCVKTKRLDVASVCLGNMKNARAAKALRKAMNEPELDARVATLAIQLNMLEEAERLLKSCKRYDILNQFYQARNEWSKAIEVAELHDRVHLRTTYYNYAKFLETSGNIQGAITNYEKSDTFRFEVPRMLMASPDQLEKYIMKTSDKSLRKWWAQYMESNGEMEVALNYYEAANDILSLVRVHCFCGNIEKAAEICNDTGDRAASYHLARQFENQENIKDAIHFYTRAHCFTNAIRLAKESGMDNELMNLALLSKPQDMIDVARYYENNSNTLDKAIILYHKAGEVSKALDLCFETEQFSTLQMVAGDLTENTDPEMLSRCSQFFMEHGQYDRAVEIAVLGKKYEEAMDLCLSYNVLISEDLAEKMTLPKHFSDTELRSRILERIAECCMQQGSYHLATKKFTQAGNKTKAMKALLKSGDTEKIIFFAGVSRQREIYVMAANYLQSLDWRKDPDIMKNIIGFYTKGRALDSLASFYDACAQVEIDEYQNYEKAAGALSESYKCLSKAKLKNPSKQEERLASIKQRITLIKKFIQAKRSYDGNAAEAMQQCRILLQEPDIETAVRTGDIYGVMIEHLAREQNFSKAFSLLEELRQHIPRGNVSFYVDTRIVEGIHKALGMPLDSVSHNVLKNSEAADSEVEIDEAVDEDLENEYE